MLTDAAVRQAKPQDKTYKLFDERGLYLEVTPTGARRWRLKYRVQGKEKLLSMGVYPDVGLKEARERRDEARKLVAKGTDPSTARKLEKLKKADTFEKAAREWVEKRFRPEVSEQYVAQSLRRLEGDIFPHIGSRPVGEVTPPELLAVLRRVEARGAVETAHRLLQHCGAIFRYALAHGWVERDPAADLRGVLEKTGKAKHHPSITDPKKVGELLRAIDGFEGTFVVRCALRLAPLVFVRPGELRRAEWAEVDLDAAEWHIPAEKMKAGGKHIVPLSRQAVAILRELHPLTGSGRYVFPSVRTGTRPMSENTVNVALRRLGYARDEMTGHGFRSIASTLLNEQGWHRDAVERQLAHAPRDKTRASYNYAEHLPVRRKMMQAWADYLDGLRKRGEVVPIRRGAA
ncbi:MAG: tyrosine-type recombinase/integrase [Deferrisomatales bacterium]